MTSFMNLVHCIYNLYEYLNISTTLQLNVIWVVTVGFARILIYVNVMKDMVDFSALTVSVKCIL